MIINNIADFKLSINSMLNKVKSYHYDGAIKRVNNHCRSIFIADADDYEIDTGTCTDNLLT